jgi:hypothetical protein
MFKKSQFFSKKMDHKSQFGEDRNKVIVTMSMKSKVEIILTREILANHCKLGDKKFEPSHLVS